MCNTQSQGLRSRTTLTWRVREVHRSTREGESFTGCRVQCESIRRDKEEAKAAESCGKGGDGGKEGQLRCAMHSQGGLRLRGDTCVRSERSPSPHAKGERVTHHHVRSDHTLHGMRESDIGKKMVTVAKEEDSDMQCEESGVSLQDDAHIQDERSPSQQAQR